MLIYIKHFSLSSVTDMSAFTVTASRLLCHEMRTHLNIKVKSNGSLGYW